jgi:hypothetical protein
MEASMHEVGASVTDRESVVSTFHEGRSSSVAPASSSDAVLLGFVAVQAAAFALAAASGNIPDVVFTVFRALLTL